MSEKPTLAGIIGEFDAGVFEQKAMEVIKKVALGIIATGKKGQVSITIDMEQIGDSNNLAVKHTLKFTQPTKNGKSSEEATTATPMYADNLGYLSVYPFDQDDLYINRTVINGQAQLVHRS